MYCNVWSLRFGIWLCIASTSECSLQRERSGYKSRGGREIRGSDNKTGRIYDPDLVGNIVNRVHNLFFL